MKPKWSKYLYSIGIKKGPFLKRVEKVLDFYQQIFPDQIEDIFVTDYFDKDENRYYGSMWLFSTMSAMEAKNFLQKDDFDYVLLRKQVHYWSIRKKEYDFTEATQKSRMLLHFDLLSRISCEMKASRENCDHLKSIFTKYILPNVMENKIFAQQADAGYGD